MALTIALDAMGGDHAPDAVIAGAALCRRTDDRLHFLLVGDRPRLEPLVKKHKALRGSIEYLHTEQRIDDNDKPAVALRQGRQSSMRLAIEAVKNGRAKAVVSAGNTGALMAMAKVVLKTLPGVERPAIAGVVPTHDSHCVMLDLGANAVCDARNLVEFALMGSVYAKEILRIEAPRIGLLNIGTEEMKGREEIREAAAMLRSSNLADSFCGFVEGTHITRGEIDVIVCDGFSGNIALKSAEGVAQLLRTELKAAVAHSWRAKLGFLLAAPALRAIRRRFDPRRLNGAMFLGLNGVVVKSHGSMDALGLSSAINTAARLVAGEGNARITAELAHLAYGREQLHTVVG